MAKKLDVVATLKEGISVALLNYVSIVCAAVLYILTIWIPYLNVGTTVAMYSIPAELAKGNNVKIDGLGTFHARLGLSKYRPGKEMDSFEEGTPKLNAASLMVTGVGYRADRELVKAVNIKCELERGGESRLKKPKYTKEERVERAIQYLRREGFMHVKDYARLNGLSYTTAYRELDGGLVGSATITSRGSKSARIFFLKPEGSGQ